MSEKKKEINEYLVNHVNPFIEPLIYEIVKKRPVDPESFAIAWLKQHVGKQHSNFRASKRTERRERGS